MHGLRIMGGCQWFVVGKNWRWCITSRLVALVALLVVLVALVAVETSVPLNLPGPSPFFSTSLCRKPLHHTCIEIGTQVLTSLSGSCLLTSCYMSGNQGDQGNIGVSVAGNKIGKGKPHTS